MLCSKPTRVDKITLRPQTSVPAQLLVGGTDDTCAVLTLLVTLLKVQPDMEELTENAEDIAEEGESKHSEQKLGRLQFKVSHITAGCSPEDAFPCGR